MTSHCKRAGLPESATADVFDRSRNSEKWSAPATLQTVMPSRPIFGAAPAQGFKFGYSGSGSSSTGKISKHKIFTFLLQVPIISVVEPEPVGAGLFRRSQSRKKGRLRLRFRLRLQLQRFVEKCHNITSTILIVINSHNIPKFLT